jgi:serine/threonine protein kinase
VSEWRLPGYDVEQLIGFGATGEVWRAREHATGETVALKRLRAGVARAAVDALRREAAVLSALGTPYVVRLRALVGDDADPVLVLDHAAGGSLAALLARRGCLTPGEVVSIGAALGQGLAAAHARGLVHGDVSPANVLFRADGMPLLSDLGVARVAGERLADADGTAEYVDPAVVRGGEPDAAADVWALAAVCHHMLAGAPPHEGESIDAVLAAAAAGSRAPLGLLAPDAPRPLVAAVESGLVADRAQRPDAAGFAALLRRSHATAPVLLTGASPAGPVPAVRPTHAVRRHAAPPAGVAAVRPRRQPRVLVALAATAAVAAAATAGWASGRHAAPLPALAVVPPDAAAVSPAPAPSPSPAPPAAPSPSLAPLAAPAPSPSPPAAPAPPTAPDWVAVVDALTQARARAFATGDEQALLAVYAPRAPGLAADRARIVDLARAGQRAHGLRHRVHSAEQLSAGADSVRLRVVDELAGYELRDLAGAVVLRGAGRPRAAHVVELTETAAGWRVVSIGRA